MPAGVARQVDLLADLDLLDGEPRAGRLEDRERRVHDLGADAVAAGDGDGNARPPRVLHEPNRLESAPRAGEGETYHRTAMVSDPLETGVRALAARLAKSPRITVVTGAGVSAASGIPTFRGSAGLWKSFRPEQLATPEAFDRDPLLVWEWYAWRRELVAQARPNRAHEVLAEWKAGAIPAFRLVTQNMQQLPERAGTRSVHALHGFALDGGVPGALRRCAGGGLGSTEGRALPPSCLPAARGLFARRAASTPRSSIGRRPWPSDDELTLAGAGRRLQTIRFVEDTWRTRFPSRSPTATASAPRSWTRPCSILKEAGARARHRDHRDRREGLPARQHAPASSPSAWESLRRTKVFLKAPITTPQGGGFKSLNVTTRKTLGLYANVRPCVSYHPFVDTKHPVMDVVIVRENEEDLYAGIEYRLTPQRRTSA